MNRRAFAKALVLWISAALVGPRGGDVGQLGDLVARWAGGKNPLLRSEVEELRLQLNALQGLLSLYAKLNPTSGAVMDFVAGEVHINNAGIQFRAPVNEPPYGSSDRLSFIDRTKSMLLDIYSWKNDYGSATTGLVVATHKSSSASATLQLTAISDGTVTPRYATLYLVSDDANNKDYAYTNVPLGVGTAPGVSVALDVPSTTRAFRPPVMTTTQRDAIGTPAAGMIIWNSTTTQLEDYNGTAWAAV